MSEPRPIVYLDAPPERTRIRDAMIELVVERGYEAVSVEDVIGRAGAGRADFERHFAGKEDCCTQIYLEDIGEFDRLVFGAYERHETWREGLRGAAYAAARYFRDRPLEIRFDVTRILAAGETPKAHRDNYMQRLVDLIDAGRSELEDPDSVSRAVAENAVGSVFELALKVIGETGDADSAESFVPGLMYVVVRPYLGHEAAHEELTIPPPPEQEEEGG